MLKSYPGFTLEFVQFDLTSSQGWPFYNWAVENEMTAFGEVRERVGDGYVAQERKKILEDHKNGTSRKN